MAVTRPLPPWHPGPLAYIDNAFRALIKTKHAIRVYRFMQAEKRRLLEVESVVVHRFLDDYHEGDGDNDAAADEDEYFDCESSLDSNASLIDHLNDAAQRVWDVPSSHSRINRMNTTCTNLNSIGQPHPLPKPVGDTPIPSASESAHERVQLLASEYNSSCSGSRVSTSRAARDRNQLELYSLVSSSSCSLASTA